jgi:parallel beta-helix repeat protein
MPTHGGWGDRAHPPIGKAIALVPLAHSPVLRTLRNAPRRSRAFGVLTAAAAALSLSAGAGSAAATVTCDRVAATGGSDGAAGTVDAPFATATKLVASLASGQTGCLRSGTYQGDLSIRTQNVTLAGYPGEQATVLGRVRVEATADNAVVEDLTLDGQNPANYLSPLIYADGVILRHNDITNHHTAICVHVTTYPGSAPPRGVVIEDNRIHDCGRLPATNFDHGIYIAEARDTVIRDNVIYGNADRGVQLYPDADGTLVTGNVIDGNGEGVIFGGNSGSSSDNNVVEHNVITNSSLRYNIESSWGGQVGTGNVARDNCTIGGAHGDDDGGVQSPSVGFTATDNLVADPGYVDRLNDDFDLAPGSPCLGDDSGSGGGSSDTTCGQVKNGTDVGDVLSGTKGRDRINGMAGDDHILGRDSRDCLIGGAGGDVIRARDGVKDEIRCGPGHDVVHADPFDAVRGCEDMHAKRKRKHKH